jgi:hypothetical protein
LFRSTLMLSSNWRNKFSIPLLVRPGESISAADLPRSAGSPQNPRLKIRAAASLSLHELRLSFPPHFSLCLQEEGVNLP